MAENKPLYALMDLRFVPPGSKMGARVQQLKKGELVPPAALSPADIDAMLVNGHLGSEAPEPEQSPEVEP